MSWFVVIPLIHRVLDQKFRFITHTSLGTCWDWAMLVWGIET